MRKYTRRRRSPVRDGSGVLRIATDVCGSQLLECALQITRQRSLDIDGRSGYRMRERQRDSMETDPVYGEHPRIGSSVDAIADDWVPDRFQMDPDLMRPAALEPHLEKAHV